MSKSEVVVRFDEVSFKYSDKKIILDKVDFSVRRNSKITIMGQNGAGKSTIFKLLRGELKPQEGAIHIDIDAKVAIAEQMISPKFFHLTIAEYLAKAVGKKVESVGKEIHKVLSTVDLNLPVEKKIIDMSGGQKARLLLAYALIQEPDILLLDEPTNNLDQDGINFLTTFLIYYQKTCIVISHDADFLNTFTDGVLNLDVNTHKVEQFVGNYYDVVQQIADHIERQRLQNSQIEKSIKDRYEKVNRLGGKSVAMRRLAKKVRAEIEEDKETMVDVRQEDRTIPKFKIPSQHVFNPVIKINQVSFLQGHSPINKKVDIELRRGEKLLISGPNGIGKTTLLSTIMRGEGIEIKPEVKIGYYSQDFSDLDFESTGLDSLASVLDEVDKERIFGVAGRFLLSGSLLANKVKDFSEGQKGLLSYARFMLQQPGLLILDEPTNHINFRHIPVIAEAIKDFEGAVILVSHLHDFVQQVEVDQRLALG